MNVLTKFKGVRAKKRLKFSLGIVGIAAVSVLTVAVSSAFLTAGTERKLNSFKGYTVTNTAIVEKHGTGFTTEGGEYSTVITDETAPQPTDWVRTINDKDVRVENPGYQGKKTVFVRVLPVFTGPTGTDTAGTAYEELTTAKILDTNLNTEYWYKGTDGYYYYKYALEPNHRTAELFTGGNITFTGVEDEAKDISLTFITDTVQAQKNDGTGDITKDYIYEAWGSTNSNIAQISLKAKGEEISSS